MTLGHLLRQAQAKELRTEMEVFLSWLLKVDRSELVAYPEREVPIEKMADVQKAWVKILEFYPVAYLTNEKEFYGLSFYVDENVLVPRDASERMVDYAKELLGERDGGVLEVGVGSGAISIALGKEQPELNIQGVDISEKALKVAQRNANAHDVDVNFSQSDLLSSVPDEPIQGLLANLPYIGEESHRYIDENVEKYEPHLALFGGPDGLELYRRLFVQIQERKYQPDWIIGEIGFSQGSLIQEVVEEFLPEYQFELRQDYEGLDRHFILTR